MSKADEVSAIRVAKKLFEWYLQPTDDEAVVNSIFAGQRSVRFNDYSLLLKGLIHGETFARDRELLLRKWSSAFDREGGVTLKDAQAFFLEWNGALDRRLFFTRSVTVGSRNARRDDPTTDYPVFCDSNRSAWTLHLTIRGAVDYSAGRLVSAQRGDLVLISPDAICQFGRKPEIDHWLHYWAVFQPRQEWKELMQWSVPTHGLFMLRIEEENDFLPFEKLFEQILKINALDGKLAERLQANLLEQLLLRATIHMETEGYAPMNERVQKAMEYLAEHLMASTSIAELAKICNLSESRLSHLFQQHLGIGVLQYRSNLRLQQAKKLLATTDETIARVAEAVGYEDPVQFSKFFSKNIGFSPREFRTSFQRI